MGDAAPPTPEHILVHGQIYQEPSDRTMPPLFASCMVIKDGLISHIGSELDEPVLAARHAGATVRDLGGQTVLPGFIDAHLHLLLVGQALTKVSLDRCKDLEDIKREIRNYAVANPAVPRIFCKGWTHAMTPEGVDAGILDTVDARPIFVDTKDLHFSWCNSSGLEEVCRVMEIGPDTPDPVGGTIQRDTDGKPNGVFGEGAVLRYMWPFVARVASMEEKKDAIRSAFRAFNAAGYTGMVDMAMDETIWEPLIALRDETGGLQGMRVAAYWLIKPTDSLDDVIAQVDRAAALAARYDAETTPDCRLVGVKVICDGIVDACTASLTEPYSNGADPDAVWPERLLHPLVARAHAAGLQVALHAIGDKTVRMAIDVLEANTDRARRPRIEHLELASPRDAARLGKLGITASIQPVHSDPAILREWPRLVGENRCRRAFAYREFADGGAPLAIGSDAPTAPHEPLPNLYVATTRRSYREPALQTVTNPEFALSVCQAVAGATHGSAYSTFADRWTGRLAVGLKADFVVCHVVLTPGELVKGVVKETWFEGKRVF